jgi:hypothetical protein
MSDVLRPVLTIAGGVVGAILGGPIGASIGSTLGGLAGGALFPIDLGNTSGPRLDDLRVMSSTIGLPIPIVYGTYAINGNMIWSSGLIEHASRKRQGGKGGPTQVTTTYTYSVNCAIGMCEGEIDGVRRIWADAKLIYDAREQLEGETDAQYSARIAQNTTTLAGMEVYLGTADQLPDPTIESFETTGNVSGFRDLAYVVFTEFQLADYGNRVPQFRFEVTVNADTACETFAEYGQEVLYPWNEDAADPRDARGIAAGAYEYRAAYSHPPGGSGWTTYAAAIATLGDGGVSPSPRPWNDTPLGWSTFVSAHGDSINPYGGFSSEVVVSYMVLNSLSGAYPAVHEIPLTYTYPFGGPATADTSIHAYLAQGEVVWWTGETTGSGDNFSGYWVHFSDAHTEAEYFEGQTAPGVALGSPVNLNVMVNAYLAVARFPCAPAPIYYGLPDAPIAGYALQEDGTYILKAEWEYVASSVKVLQKYTDDGVSPPTVTKYPLGPVRPSGHADDTEAFWEAAYDAAVIDGTMAGGLTYGVDYPQTQAYHYTVDYEVCTVNALSITLGSIVRDVCLRCGLTEDQIDVSDLTELVDGYALGTVMSGRDAISPLRSFGFFDCVESEGVLKWPTRGKAAVATLTADDLAAHESGSGRPASMETSRTQEVDLPRRLRVHYAQTAQNYESGEQSASRISVGADEVRDIEVAVAMSHQKAAQIADVLLYDSWISRNRHQLTLDQSFVYLDPADAITAPVDGRQERMRIVDIEHRLPGLIRISAVRDDDGVYTSYALGTPTAGAGTGGAVSGAGTADMALLDLPALRDADDDAGYYVAVNSSGSTFGGAVVMRSPDGGTTFDQVGVVSTPAIMGTVSTALATGPTTIIDEGNALLVTLSDDSELESISETSLLAGLNAAVIGSHGRWEVIQFRDAELTDDTSNVWTLTGLLRGRRGTEWAVGTSQDDDRFVLLDSSIIRVAMNASSIGAERVHRAVLSGTSIDTADDYDFTGEGGALKPFSVVDVQGERAGGDLVITFIRRSRLGQELPSGADIPLNEETESYECDILTDLITRAVLRTLTSSSETFTYTAAQQTADFGSPPASVDLEIFQRSAVVGRGHATEATL